MNEDLKGFICILIVAAIIIVIDIIQTNRWNKK